jgi:hypothetical protein
MAGIKEGREYVSSASVRSITNLSGDQEMLTALNIQVNGFIVCEGEVLTATLIAVDFSDIDPLVTLAHLDGAVLLYMADIFYTDREVAQRDADKEASDETGDLCEECATQERMNVLFDGAAKALHA